MLWEQKWGELCSHRSAIVLPTACWSEMGLREPEACAVNLGCFLGGTEVSNVNPVQLFWELCALKKAVNSGSNCKPWLCPWGEGRPDLEQELGRLELMALYHTAGAHC